MARLLRVAGLRAGVVAVVLLSSGMAAAAQELSVGLTLDATSYRGDPYASTNGDRGGEVNVGVETSRGLRLGGGLFVGKCDEPVSDASFTAVGLFFEPAWILRRKSRVRLVVGMRVSWEHQRVGDVSNGLWAYGWGVGAVGGVLIRLGEPVTVGV